MTSNIITFECYLMTKRKVIYCKKYKTAQHAESKINTGVISFSDSRSQPSRSEIAEFLAETVHTSTRGSTIT